MNLLLAAFPPELGDLVTAPPPGWEAACVGVGPVASAAATAYLLEAKRPERVLFLGTCGAYDGRFEVGDLVAVKRVIERTLLEVRGEAYRPGIQTSLWDSAWHLDLPGADVLAQPAILATDEGARAMAAVAPLEHLELAGVFEACRQADIPVAAVLGVANRVGPDAQEQWRANHLEVSRALQAEVRRQLA